MAKVHAMRTYAPLQFEALEPHRFEDLVRSLLYDFKDWQRIEATGRGGSDDGFDVRAYEKATSVVTDDSGDEEAEEPHTVEGNLWMIQCKREKILGPGRVKSIVEESVKKESPPYGYILAAPANFTKKAYDAFRASLVERGVMEFHLLGRAGLEDMLYLPKNDRVLFAFFGVSLVSKKRTRVTEVRTKVNTKNKLYKVLGEGNPNNNSVSTHVLIRDIDDEHYPRSEKYKDFEKRPRWKEYIACRYYPDGVRFNMREHFAYIDHKKKEWDFAAGVDLVYREVRDEAKRESESELHQKIHDFWNHLPRAVQGKYIRDGIMLYESILFIDREGDALFGFPHLYADFGGGSPFDGFWEFIRYENDSQATGISEYKKVDFFPTEFPARKFGKVYKEKNLAMESHYIYRLKGDSDRNGIFIDAKNEYAYLKQRDVISVTDPDNADSKLYVEVTHRYGTKAADLYEHQPNMRWTVDEQLGREAKPKEKIEVLELRLVYDFELERR